MLRQLIYVVGGLLVSVTSEQICAVCGDGYQVGNPSAVGAYPGNQDTPVRCDDIEFAGLRGLIPISQCAFLPSLIFATCDCQPTTKETTSEDGNAVYGQGYSSQRRVQYYHAPAVAPSSSVYGGSPVATAVAPSNSVYGGSPVATTFQIDGTPVTAINANASNDNQGFGFPIWLLLVVFLPLMLFIALVICNYMCRLADEEDRRLIIARQHGLASASTIGRELDDDDKRRRPLVLEALFPNEGKVSTEPLVAGEEPDCSSRTKEYI